MSKPAKCPRRPATTAAFVIMLVGCGPPDASDESPRTRAPDPEVQVDGHVYLRVDDGEVRRGAGVRVSFLRRTPEVVGGWPEMCDALESEFIKPYAEEVARRNREYRQRHEAASGMDEVDVVLEWMEYQRASAAVTAQKSREALQRRVDWIEDQALRTTSADVDARFEVNLPPGRYWAFAELQTGERRIHHWIVPVVLQHDSPLTVDLNNNNVGRPNLVGCGEDNPNPFVLEGGDVEGGPGSPTGDPG